MPMEESGPDRWFVLNSGGRRWPDLGDVLLEGERVAFVDVGRVLPSRFPRVARWFVIVTDRRLICLAKSRRSARKQLHVSLDRVTHAYQHGAMGRKVMVITQRGKLRVHGMNRVSGAQLVTLLVAAVRGDRTLAMAYAVPPASAPQALPPAAAAAHEALVTRVEELEGHVDRLTQQVRFLEELMPARRPSAAGASVLTSTTPCSAAGRRGARPGRRSRGASGRGGHGAVAVPAHAPPRISARRP